VQQVDPEGMLFDAGDADEFVCYAEGGCGERGSLAEAHNLAEARLQDRIDYIFGKEEP